MKNKIRWLKVEIRPMSFNMEGFSEIEIVCLVNSKKVSLLETVEQDELLSYFDQIFDNAKEKIKNNMMREDLLDERRRS